MQVEPVTWKCGGVLRGRTVFYAKSGALLHVVFQCGERNVRVYASYTLRARITNIG
jgi:hypothetical protein